MSNIKNIALVAGILLTSSSALAEPVTLSITQVDDGIVVSCTDVLVDIPSEEVKAYRKTAKATVEGVRISERSCVSLNPHRKITEECVYNSIVGEMKFSYVFHFYMRGNGSTKEQCMRLDGIYVKSKGK